MKVSDNINWERDNTSEIMAYTTHTQKSVVKTWSKALNDAIREEEKKFIFLTSYEYIIYVVHTILVWTTYIYVVIDDEGFHLKYFIYGFFLSLLVDSKYSLCEIVYVKMLFSSCWWLLCVVGDT